MCDQCDGPAKKAPAPVELSAKPLSRRTLLAMGSLFTSGIALGLITCKSESPATFPAGTASRSQPVLPATTQAASATASHPATSQAAATSQASATMTTAESATSPAPDLGAEVFPDATGRAIAKISDAPVIMVPRSDWTSARPKFAQLALMNGISRMTVHHTAGEIQTDAWKPTAADLEGIREFHAGTKPTDRNWADIAYHFAVDRAGRVWQARPLVYQGAHAKSNNEHNLGIVLLGNFEVQSPSAAQLTALAGFIGFVRKLYKVPLDQLFTHGELGDTSCPGKALQEYMNRTRVAWASEEGVQWKAATHPATAASARTAQ